MVPILQSFHRINPFKEFHMDEHMKSRLTSSDVWVRGLYMLFFAIAWGLAEVVLSFCVVFQFIGVLFTGSANQRLLRFGQNLSRYHYRIAQFVSFNTEEKPFPFADWPDDEPGGERWQDREPAPTDSAKDSAPTGGAAIVATAIEEEAPQASEEPPVNESRKDEPPPPA
jgi:hypothetical protein